MGIELTSLEQLQKRSYSPPRVSLGRGESPHRR